jgi:hypothetical protein
MIFYVKTYPQSYPQGGSPTLRHWLCRADAGVIDFRMAERYRVLLGGIRLSIPKTYQFDKRHTQTQCQAAN